MRSNNSNKQNSNALGRKPKSSPLLHIPEGNYEAVCIRTEISRYLRKKDKLYLHFRIIDGEYEGTELFGIYNFNYKFFPRAAKYYTDWSIANGFLPKRKDRLTPRVFKGKAFLVKVRDVMPKYEDGTPMPTMFRYSVVDRIVDKLTM